ncbi:HNH endonuclease signature motif containing protein [Mesorhizobium sp. LSHC412B00]|uniref:HNH endonuclease n=1 Tax=Mesorhizobium sp. LSHC412B00 TaxID=1287285 RepID=UPI001FD9DC20|nr:HNH endonuclease signature motif containing protein [Mesorhizobium sp. LSHC412B00]
MRQAIVFELRALEAVEEATQQVEPQIGRDIDALRARAFAASVEAPGRRVAESTIIQRSRDVRDYVVARARGNCESCGQAAPFLRPNGVPYLEPHHIRRLSDGGPDNPRFVIGLCPNCHRRAHSGADGRDYNARMLERMVEIEPD